MQVNASSSSVLNQGLQGLQKSQQEIQRSASDIARAGAEISAQASQPQSAESVAAPQVSTDLIEPIINLKRQEQLFNASAQIVKTADETLGSLLDVKA